MSELPLAWVLPGIGDQRRRRLIAHPQAGRPYPDCTVTNRDLRSVRRVMKSRPGDGLELRDDAIGVTAFAGDVVADVHDTSWTR